jgi:hypothetical protein
VASGATMRGVCPLSEGADSRRFSSDALYSSTREGTLTPATIGFSGFVDFSEGMMAVAVTPVWAAGRVRGGWMVQHMQRVIAG